MDSGLKSAEKADDIALNLISRYLEEVSGKKVEIDNDLVIDQNFYQLIEAFESIARNTLKKDIRDFVNLGFIDVEQQTGADIDLKYRRKIIRLCIYFCAECK